VGPNLLLDKSAFQALSYAEHRELAHYFEVNTAPVLILEIMGDLAKKYRDGTPSADKARELARKFAGLEWLNENYSFICVQTLLGTKVPLDGHIVPAYMTVGTDGDGSPAALVEPGPLNELVTRLASGNATAVDETLAKMWRRAATGLSLNGLNDFVNAHHIIVPRATSVPDAVAVARSLLETPALQDVWLGWLLDELGVPAPERNRIIDRWRLQGLRLGSFAPYAHYCAHALLSMFVAWRNALIGWKSTNILDLQYLYYAPFCSVFVSDDKVHRTLAPPLMRPDQTFVQLQDFKAALRSTREYFERMAEPERAAARASLGEWPPENSLIRELWIKNERWVGPPPTRDPSER
jgi:hypothetical protein